LQKIVNLRMPLAPWVQPFTMVKTRSKIYLSLTQGFEAGYAGLGGIYSIDPASLRVKTEIYYSAVGAWWNSTDGPALGGSWGGLVDGDQVYFGGFAINDVNGYFTDVTTKSVEYLPDGTHEIWSLAKLGDTVYAGTSFDIYTSARDDLHSWGILPGTHRRTDIDENVIWGMTSHDGVLYAVSNFLYRYDFEQQRLIQLGYFDDMPTLKPILAWKGKIWFSGFGRSTDQKYTYLVSYDPKTGTTRKWRVGANAITDLATLGGKLYLAGYTAPRVAGVDYMRGNKGRLFEFDGKTVRLLLQLDRGQGLAGLVGFNKYVYFANYRGDIYRYRVRN
jgi:hypothetical protein